MTTTARTPDHLTLLPNGLTVEQYLDEEADEVRLVATDRTSLTLPGAETVTDARVFAVYERFAMLFAAGKLFGRLELRDELLEYLTDPTRFPPVASPAPSMVGGVEYSAGHAAALEAWECRAKTEPATEVP